MLNNLDAEERVRTMVSRLGEEAREVYLASLSEPERRVWEGKLMVAMRPEVRAKYVKSFDEAARRYKEASMLIAMPVLDRSKHLRKLPPGFRVVVEGIMLAWVSTEEACRTPTRRRSPA